MPTTTVKPDHILKQLADLWVTSAKSEPSPKEADGAGVLRACSLTLIVFVDDEEDAMALGETVARLMREHPSRTIVVRLRSSSDELDARVFEQCWMPFGHNRQICCEQVELTVSVNRLGDVPSIVSPLAAPDLPRVVWFRSARLTSAPDISQILALGDKLIVDSARPGAPAFADLRALTVAGFVVGDLSWTRLTKLRELIAQLLESRDLATIRKVTIEHCAAEAGPEAKYLQAWLRTSLPGATVGFETTGDGVGDIKGIRIEPDIDIRVETDCADFQSRGLRQHANLFQHSDSELLSEELSIMRHDPVFEQTLRRMSIWAPQF
jgi:glucose-6-phosphate dehydrogenase assembly protein OpcA